MHLGFIGFLSAPSGALDLPIGSVSVPLARSYFGLVPIFWSTDGSSYPQLVMPGASYVSRCQWLHSAQRWGGDSKFKLCCLPGPGVWHLAFCSFFVSRCMWLHNAQRWDGYSKFKFFCLLGPDMRHLTYCDPFVSRCMWLHYAQRWECYA